MSNKKLVVLLAGGGSGGHIYPLLAVCEKLIKLSGVAGSEVDFHYAGSVDVMSVILAEKYGAKMHPILTAKVRRYFSLANIIDIPKFFLSLIQAWFKLFWIMPDVVFSKGGPGALPVVLASWFYRVPVLIHESDSVPGLTNVVSSRFAKRVAVSFEKTLVYFDTRKVFLSGNPIREDLEGERYLKEIAKEELNFKGNEPLLLVLGGSQGAKKINDFILSNLSDILKESQILHQTGTDNYLEVERLSRAALMELPVEEELTHRYQALAYLEKNMKAAFLAADVVAARAGAGTIFEVASFGKPAILIPLSSSAQDHQKINAFEFARAGGGVVIEEENLMEGIFIHQLKEILGNQQKMESMSKASAKFFRPGAAEMIAEEIFKLAGLGLSLQQQPR